MSLMPRTSSLRYFYERRGSKNDIILRAQTAAYAHYVLASNNEGDIGKVRYHFENHRHKMETPLSYAYLGGALRLLGDDERADEAFAESLRRLGYKNSSNYYYSNVRDLAGIIAIAAEVGMDDFAVARIEALSDAMRNRGKYLNTQERGFLILAFKALLKNADPAKVRAENVSLTNTQKAPTANLIAEDLSRNPVFTNETNQKIWASVTIDGAPKEAPRPMADKIEVVKTLYTKDGEKLTGDVVQGDEVVVVIEFRAVDYISRSIVVADLLPAGFEIETILSHSDGNRGRKKKGVKGAYSWAGNLIRPQIAEKRDDRFVASTAIYGSAAWKNKKRPYNRVAYIMRAVTPGEFTMPGVVVEDMYRAEDYGLSLAGRINITPRVTP